MNKLWPKYKNWSKLENRTGLYRYMSNLYRYKLAKNDQNRNITGTSPKTAMVYFGVLQSGFYNSQGYGCLVDPKNGIVEKNLEIRK